MSSCSFSNSALCRAGLPNSVDPLEPGVERRICRRGRQGNEQTILSAVVLPARTVTTDGCPGPQLDETAYRPGGTDSSKVPCLFVPVRQTLPPGAVTVMLIPGCGAPS